MTARLDGEQKGGNPLLPDTQGGGLHYDRSHRKLTKDGFESAAHLTAYAQKSIVVVVASVACRPAMASAVKPVGITR